jgi:hypothetical protein
MLSRCWRIKGIGIEEFLKRFDRFCGFGRSKSKVYCDLGRSGVNNLQEARHDI